MSEEEIKLLRENNRMLKEILSILENMVSDDTKLKEGLKCLGIGLCSTIIGGRILGLQLYSS